MSVESLGSRIVLLSDNYEHSHRCLKDQKPEIDQRRIAIWSLPSATYITYERYPDVNWFTKLMCCFCCTELPTTVHAVQALSKYILNEYGDIALRLAQKLSGIDLSKKQTLLIKERKILLSKASELKQTQKKIDLMMLQLKYFLLVDRKEQATPSSHARGLIPFSEDFRPIFVLKNDMKISFNEARLLNDLENLGIISGKKLVKQALEEIVTDVKVAILKESADRETLVTTEKITELVARELKLRNFEIQKPLIFDFIGNLDLKDTALVLSDDNLLMIHNKLNDSSSDDRKVDV